MAISAGRRLRFRHLFLIVSAIVVLSPAGSAWSAEPRWPKEPYRDLVIDQDLREVLSEFGRNVRVPMKVSDGIAGRRVRNDLAVAAPRDFLQRLCDSYGLVWYFDGAVLHVSDESEVRTELLNIGAVTSETLVLRLNALGVADSRYAIRASGANGVISVSGPPPYLSMVKKTVAAIEKSVAPRPVQEVIDGDTLKVRVFRGSRQGS
jgi:type III secretion protein C